MIDQIGTAAGEIWRYLNDSLPYTFYSNKKSSGEMQFSRGLKNRRGRFHKGCPTRMQPYDFGEQIIG